MTTAAQVQAPATSQVTTAATPPEVAPAGAGETPAQAAPAAEARKPIAKEFSVLARREQALQKERAAMKAREAEIAQREARAKEIEERFGTKPKSAREALERYGYTYGDATQAELNDGEPSPIEIARQVAAEETAKVRQELEEKDRKKTEDQQKALQAQAEKAVAEFKTTITEFVKSKPDEYELVTLFEADEVIYQTVEEHYTKTGAILSLKEASDLVEQYLEEQVERARSTKRLKAKWEPGKPSEAGDSSKPEKPGQVSAQRRTLSSDLTSSTPTLVSSPLVEEDRMKRALAALG